MSRQALIVTPLAALALSCLLPTASAQSGDLPERPEGIAFPPLEFAPPSREAYRHEVEGVVVYLVPSRELPLIDLRFSFRGGAYLDPEGQEGLAAALGSMLRRGGTANLAAQELDEKLDFLAAELSTDAGSYETTASLNTLSRNFEAAFALFMDVVRRPGFQADRLQLFKDEALEGMKQRNDDAGAILRREWAGLIYGPDSFKARVSTRASVESLDEAKLRALHRRVINPANLVIGVSGDFEAETMLAQLTQALAGWERGEPLPAVPNLPHTPQPGVYYVQKDIPQGKVQIGMRGVQRDHPDAVPLEVMSLILGAGGFTSRITNRVRTEEGLAYSARASWIPGLHFPGEFRASFQSKSATCALAIKLIYEEVARIRSEPVTAEELSIAKSSLVETFPQTFGSKADTVGVFVDDELTGRDPAHWSTYREKVRAVTAEEVLRVAKAHLDPAKLAIMVVGDWASIAKGDLDGRASMQDFFDGTATRLPLRDPLTQEPLKE
jgi:predicted Zn-dependent peptidase